MNVNELYRRRFLSDMNNRPGVGTSTAVVQAVVQVMPAHVRLVGVVLQGRPSPRWWRWAEPVALWLLRRAGFEVCR